MKITLQINGENREAEAAPRLTLLDLLRDKFGLTAAKKGCNQGVCGACTVLIDGHPVRACLTLAVTLSGHEITTVEGLTDNGAPTGLQQAFIDAGAVQCGFCTSGMLISAHALLNSNPDPGIDDIRTALSGNLCRCTGYRKIVEAVRDAARSGRT